MRIILLILLTVFAIAGCSSPPEKKIITRSELEKMTVTEKGAAQQK